MSSLVAHAATKKHDGFAKSMGSTVTIMDALKPKTVEPQHVSELKLAVYIAGIGLLFSQYFLYVIG